MENIIQGIQNLQNQLNESQAQNVALTQKFQETQISIQKLVLLNDELNKERMKALQEASHEENERQKLSAALQEVEREISALREAHREERAKNSELNSRISSLNQQIQQAESRIGQIKEEYEHEQARSTKLLLEKQSDLQTILAHFESAQTEASSLNKKALEMGQENRNLRAIIENTSQQNREQIQTLQERLVSLQEQLELELHKTELVTIEADALKQCVSEEKNNAAKLAAELERALNVKRAAAARISDLETLLLEQQMMQENLKKFQESRQNIQIAETLAAQARDFLREVSLSSQVLDPEEARKVQAQLGEDFIARFKGNAEDIL